MDNHDPELNPTPPEPPPAASRRWWWPAVLLLAAGASAALSYKVVHMPEWVVLTGSEAKRQEICRSVYQKSARRAAWCFTRLLRDRATGVRITAIGALTYAPTLHERFAPAVCSLAGDPDSRVRGRALEFLFQHGGMEAAEWRQHTATELQDATFREQNPLLLSFYMTRALEEGDAAPVDWALSLLETNMLDDPAVLDALVRHPDLTGRFRDRLIADLDRAGGASRTFLLAALTAIDGQMRGTRAEAWRLRIETPTEEVESQRPLTEFTVEAEWAHRLQSNFEIAVQEDELCLLLGEGAGGEHFWRRHEYSSVDIGKAFFSFTLEQSGTYQIWCRCWFSDKCGNHSLLHIDDRWLQWRQAGVDDQTDILRTWHWKRLETNVQLSQGQHTLRLTAGDDGLLIDKLSIVPDGSPFDPAAPPQLTPLYDPAIPTCLSITPQMQSQWRGTTQTVSVWVRRNSPLLREGRISLTVPPPFALLGPSQADIRFAPASAVASADFQVTVPKAAVGGEGTVTATFTAGGQDIAVGSRILGVTYDWLTTGPLEPHDPRCRELRSKTALRPEDLSTGWSPYPAAGSDRYRRLTFEDAYGQMRDKVIFLYTEIEVSTEGDYQSFLNIDDSGYVFIDGDRVSGRHEDGVGEGWLLVDSCHLTQGRHSVFAWVYQADFPEPNGSDAGRHTPNHWNFKWLLRKNRQEPAEAIRGLPFSTIGTLTE